MRPDDPELDIDTSKLTVRDIVLLTHRDVRDIKPRLLKVENDIIELKIGAAKQSSFFDGAKAMWGFILSLPVGLLGLVVGIKQ